MIALPRPADPSIGIEMALSLVKVPVSLCSKYVLKSTALHLADIDRSLNMPKLAVHASTQRLLDTAYRVMHII
jgi:hypothetical protein